MLTWILSLVGLGGIGAALAFIPGALPFALAGQRSLWGMFTRYPREAAIVALIALSAWLWRGWDHEKAGRHSDAVAFQTVSDQSRSAQFAVNHEPARVSGNIAREANATAPAYYDQLHRAADGHAIRLPEGAAGLGPTGLPRADPSQPGLHRSADAPELVCRPAKDDSLLVTAAGRAARMLAQVKGWIESGIAIAEPADVATAPPDPLPTS